MTDRRTETAKSRYLNFPIYFLKGFLEDPDTNFTFILAYSMYEKVFSENATLDSIDDFLLNSEVETYELDLEQLSLLGEELYDKKIEFEESKGKKIPMVGIRVDLFNDFYRMGKNDFELVCLLAYLAIRSIIQKSDYRNIKNNLLLARMAGYSSTGHPIPEELSHWMASSRYRRTKVFNALRDRYKLKTAYKARGITCSFSLSQEDLEFKILQAKSKKQNKGGADRKKAKEKAIERAKKQGI